MSKSNKISASFSETDKEAVLAKIAEVKALMPFLIGLTLEERKTLRKMGPKSVDYVRQSLEGAKAFPDELKKSFAEAVDFYIENTTKDGRPAQKPYSGRMMLRVPPEVHAQASISAALGGKSLNQWVADVIRTAAHA